MNLEKITVESAKKDSSVHFFPCEIKYNGEAEVDRYFNTSIKECKREDGEGILIFIASVQPQYNILYTSWCMLSINNPHDHHD